MPELILSFTNVIHFIFPSVVQYASIKLKFNLSRYTPVRSDGVVGDLVLSEPSYVLYPGIAIFFSSKAYSRRQCGINDNLYVCLPFLMLFLRAPANRKPFIEREGN